jgi:hypothetical protein
MYGGIAGLGVAFGILGGLVAYCTVLAGFQSFMRNALMILVMFTLNPLACLAFYSMAIRIKGL